MRLLLPLFAVFCVGCRGPAPEKIVGTGLLGAAVFGLVTWMLLHGVIRVWDRLSTRAWQPPPSAAGWKALIAVHGALTLLAGFGAKLSNDDGLIIIVWGCAAANHLAWALLIWRLSRIPPAWAATWAAIPSLALAIFGSFGSRDAAEWSIVMWFWGGFLGAAPGVLILALWLEGYLRGRAKVPPPD